MLFGQLLFTLAALSIVGATLAGLVLGLGKIVLYKLKGRDLSPRPDPGSPAWIEEDRSTTVDVSKKSILTERIARSVRDPVVQLGADKYRVTRLGATRFLVTEVGEGRRIGAFELDGNGSEQQVLPEPDAPDNARLLVQIAVLASFVRRRAAA
jgi:hypothetical protein